MPRFIALVLFFFVPAFAVAQDKPQPVKTPSVELIAFDAPEAKGRLTGKYMADFFSLVNQFEPQMNLGTCGPTSSVIVMNALRPAGDIRRPIDTSAFPAPMRKGLPKGMEPVNPRYTQRAFFDERFNKVKAEATFYGAPDAKGKRDPGIQLRQLSKILELHELDVTVRIVGDETPEKEILNELRENLSHGGDYVIVNYSRALLGQPGGGHISPVAAYDKKSDSFLVMDVNPNRAPWVWVPAKALIAAMRTHDTVENRGYLLIKERSSPAAPSK